MKLFRHTRSGNIYELVTTAKHSEREDEELVIYRNFAKTDNDVVRTWARPINNFYEVIDNNVERFTAITNITDIFTESEIETLKKAIKNPDSINDSVIRFNADYFQKYIEE